MTLDDYVYRYPTEAVFYQKFTLDMRNCIVDNFSTGNWVANQEYILYTPVEKYKYTQWQSLHKSGTNRHNNNSGWAGDNCRGYTIEFSVKWINYYGTKLDISDLNGNFIWNQDTGQADDKPSFWLQSDDIIDLNTAR